MPNDVDWDGVVNRKMTGEALIMSAQFAFDYFNGLIEQGFTREESMALTRDIQVLYWNFIFQTAFLGNTGK